MSNIKSIEKDRTFYCDYIGKEVSIHCMIHPILDIEYFCVCDYSLSCKNNKCKYKGEDN